MWEPGGGHNQVQGCTEDKTPSGYHKDEEGGVQGKRDGEQKRQIQRKNRAKSRNGQGPGT